MTDNKRQQHGHTEESIVREIFIFKLKMGKKKSKSDGKGLISISSNPPAVSNSDGMMFLVMAVLGASSPVCTLVIFGSDIMSNLNYVIIALGISVTLLLMGYYSLATKYRTSMYNEIKGLNDKENQDVLLKIIN